MFVTRGWDIQKLVDHIYDSLVDDQLLARLPEKIAKVMQTRSALFQVWERDGRVRSIQTNGYFSDEMLYHYVEQGFSRLDSWADALFHPDRLDKGPVRGSDFLPTDKFRDTAFYNDFFRRFGDDTGQCLGGGYSFTGDGILGISVHRAHGDAEFEEHRVAQMREVAGHLARMLRMRDRLKATERRTHALEATLDSFEGAIVLLDSSGKVEFANASALDLAKGRGSLQIVGGRILLADHQADQRLQAAISSRHRVGGNGDSFICHGDMAQPRRVHVMPCQRGAFSGCMVVIECGEVSLNAARRLQLLYGLSPAEARVALGIADGQSASELAESLSVSPATVRTQLRHVFEKTQISKATQLSRLIASLPPFPAEPWGNPDRTA